MSCAHCVLSSSIGFSSSLLSSSATKLAYATGYHSNVNFVRRNPNLNPPNTPNTKEKPLHSIEFRSVQPKKRNSIDYTETAVSTVAKKLQFSPTTNKKMEAVQNQETNASKRFLIECFDATVPLRWRDMDEVAVGERFTRIYVKCWHQSGSARPSSKRLSAVFKKLL